MASCVHGNATVEGELITCGWVLGKPKFPNKPCIIKCKPWYEYQDLSFQGIKYYTYASSEKANWVLISLSRNIQMRKGRDYCVTRLFQLSFVLILKLFMSKITWSFEQQRVFHIKKRKALTSQEKETYGSNLLHGFTNTTHLEWLRNSDVLWTFTVKIH